MTHTRNSRKVPNRNKQHFPLRKKVPVETVSFHIRINYSFTLLTYSTETWSYAAKMHIKSLLQVQNSTIRQTIDMPCCVRNKYIYRQISAPRFRDFIQELNANFHLSVQNSSNWLLFLHMTLLPGNRKKPCHPFF